MSQVSLHILFLNNIECFVLNNEVKTVNDDVFQNGKVFCLQMLCPKFLLPRRLPSTHVCSRVFDPTSTPRRWGGVQPPKICKMSH